MRQLRIDAATGQSPGPAIQADLLPLAGHLGTSLGAVDAAGQVQEAVATDAFGQLRIPGSPANPGGFTNDPAGGWQQSHLFAGEYWDQDSQLLYLRARWYDPKLGRFISGDPFEGRQRADWRHLNRPGGRQAAMVLDASPCDAPVRPPQTAPTETPGTAPARPAPGAV